MENKRALPIDSICKKYTSHRDSSGLYNSLADGLVILAFFIHPSEFLILNPTTEVYSIFGLLTIAFKLIVLSSRKSLDIKNFKTDF